MKRILLLCSMFFTVFAFSALAQRTVTGKVTDDAGEGLPGVNVVIKGTTTGATTDLDGNFRLSVEDGTTLVFSFVGFETQEVEVGNRTAVDITLGGVTELQEVVVTALGISKEKAALGYGVTSIGGEELAGRQEADVARMLRGKATGVQITQTSGLSGSGTNIIIRGYSSITGSNQPLFVVDGIPFNTDANSGTQGFQSGGATASSRFLDLDPNNIADISILKGLSATVLYGEAGRNGVVLVTTKNGKGGANSSKKTEISFTQGIFQTEIANLPEYQNTFGNGFSGGFGWFFSNWGAAFDDLNPATYGSDYQGEANGQVLITHPYDQTQYNDDFPEYIGADYAYEPYESVENFFQKGLSSNTSVSISSKLADNASMSLSYSYLSEDGFTPHKDDLRDNARSNFLDKHNFGLGAQTQLQNGLKLSGVFNFVSSKRESPITAPAFGGGGNGLFAAILFTPRSMDLVGLPYQSPIDGSNVYYRRGSAIQNPRWTLNNTAQEEQVNRFYSATNASYEISDNISVAYRLSLDRYDQRNIRYINRGGARVPDGEMSTFTTANFLTDQVLNILYNFPVNESFKIDGVVGLNSRRDVRERHGLFSSNQFVYNLINHGNFIDHDGFSDIREENTTGVYATTSLSYKDYLYLNLQARNDWTSTLEEENRSVLYPSASVSFIPTDAFAGLQSSGIINSLKLRVGYGTSAGYPSPYRTRSILESSTNVFVPTGGTPININSVSNTLGNRSLERELFTELEGGIEASLLNNRVSLDLSVYQKQSEDLIVRLPLDPSTGYTATTVNAAKMENKGIELGVGVTTPLPQGIQWKVDWNYTKNVSDVISIFEGIDQVRVSGYNTLGNYAIPGEQFGIIYGESFLKDDAGQLVVDNQGNYQSSGNFGKIGDPNPDYTMNLINGFTWKGISFGFHWEYIKGGDIFSSTVQAMLARGNTSDTDVDRTVPIILPGVKQVGTDGDGAPVYEENDIQTYIGDSFFRAYFFADEGGVFDASVIRLRQVSIGYVLPKSLLENTPFGTVGITLSGENLFYNAPNFPKGINFDPEISSLGVGNGRGFDFRTAPTSKKYGVTLNATF